MPLHAGRAPERMPVFAATERGKPSRLKDLPKRASLGLSLAMRWLLTRLLRSKPWQCNEEQREQLAQWRAKGDAAPMHGPTRRKPNASRASLNTIMAADLKTVEASGVPRAREGQVAEWIDRAVRYSSRRQAPIRSSLLPSPIRSTRALALSLPV